MQPDPEIGVLDALAFFVELAMVVVLVLAGRGMADGAFGWGLGVFLGLVSVAIWSQWMAPRSARRLENPLRLYVQVALFLVVALYAAAGGLWIAGIVFALVAIAVFTALYRAEYR